MPLLPLLWNAPAKLSSSALSFAASSLRLCFSHSHPVTFSIALLLAASALDVRWRQSNAIKGSRPGVAILTDLANRMTKSSSDREPQDGDHFKYGFSTIGTKILGRRSTFCANRVVLSSDRISSERSCRGRPHPHPSAGFIFIHVES